MNLDFVTVKPSLDAIRGGDAKRRIFGGVLKLGALDDLGKREI